MPRSFTVHAAPQGTPEWLRARLGRVTASRAKDMLATLKGGGEAAARRDYRIELACERLTGEPAADVYVNDDMRRGTELEPEAFAAYEAQTGRWVDRVGFLAHTELMAGGSPDGVVGDYEGLIEIKAPRPANHLRYLRQFGVPKEHEAQCLHLLWLTVAPWIDFVSYCPPMPEHLRLHVVRYTASEDALNNYDEEVQKFCAEVDNEVAALTPVGVALVNGLEATNGI